MRHCSRHAPWGASRNPRLLGGNDACGWIGAECLLSCLVILLATCDASARKLAYTEGELREVIEARLTPVERSTVKVPFAIDDEIRGWAAEVTAASTTPQGLAEALAKAIIDDPQLAREYDPSVTSTARQVFRTGRGNCISLANLFVGAARSLGLPAYYVDVTQATRLTKHGDRVIAEGHICAAIWLEHRFLLYDFAKTPERGYRRYAILDDQEMLANFILSRSLNKMLRGGTKRGTRLLEAIQEDTRLALKLKPDFAKARVNLGTAYLRVGRREEALAEYRKALSLDSRLLAAHVAMGYLYAQDGAFAEAAKSYQKAKSYLPEDGIIRYELGMVHYRAGRPAAALRDLKKARELRPDLAEVETGLGVVYRALGDEEAALKAFARARQIAVAP